MPAFLFLLCFCEVEHEAAEKVDENPDRVEEGFNWRHKASDNLDINRFFEFRLSWLEKP